MLATYEYQCDTCSSAFELRRDWKISATQVACPMCQSAQVHRVFSPVMTLSRSSDGALKMISGSGCDGCTAPQCSGCSSNY